MTSGTRNYDAFSLVQTAAGPDWIGTKGSKTWNGGDKVIRRVKVPKPRAPKVSFAKRPKPPPPKPYLGKKERLVISKRKPEVRIPHSPARRSSAKALSAPEIDPGPYGGRETLRWSDVNRHENAAPKRASEEFHDYDMSVNVIKQQLGRFVIVDNPNIPTYLSGQGTPIAFGAMPTLIYPGSANAQNALLGKLHEKIAGSDFNAGVFLGESGKALDLISGHATRLLRAYLHVRKGDLYSAAVALGVSPKHPRVERSAASSLLHRRLKRRPINGTTNLSVKVREVVDRDQRFGVVDVAERWLELQYGIIPLLKDVYGAAEFLAHHLNVPLRQRVVVRRTIYGTMHTASPLNVMYTRRQCLRRLQIIAYITEKDVAQLAGLTNPASVAHELMPLSFVLDWFIPIGSWLAARGTVNALQGLFISTNTAFSRANGLQVRSDAFPGTVVPGDFSWEEKIVSRRVTTSLSSSLPEYVPLSEAFSWKRAANSVALLVTALSGNTRGLRDLTD